jgi:hypothetical protein
LKVKKLNLGSYPMIGLFFYCGLRIADLMSLPI